jgi:N-acetylglucosamine repressor
MSARFTRGVDGADTRLIRSINRNALFTVMRSSMPITVSQLSARTGLSLSTVNSVLKDLMDVNLVLAAGTTVSTGGRKPVAYSLNLRDTYVCGADLNARTIRVALLRLDGSIIRTSTLQVENVEPHALASALADTLGGLAADAGIGLEHVIGLGLSQYGIVDPEGKRIRLDIQHGWREVSLGSMLQQRLPMPVFVIEDTLAKLTAELEFGSAKNRQHVLYLLFGSLYGQGISGRFVSDGAILTGVQGFAGQFGHILIDPSGPVCSCGRRGCWEAVGDVSHLLERTKGLMGGPSAVSPDGSGSIGESLSHVRAAAEQGDAAVSGVLDWFVGIQADGIANLIHTFNPKHIVIDGEVVVLGNVFLERLRLAIEQRVMKPYLEELDVEFSTIGDDGTLLGASAIVLREAISIMEQGLTQKSMRR